MTFVTSRRPRLPRRRRDLLIIGDSLTAGHHATQPDGAFPALMRQWLAGHRAGMRFREIGVPGASVDDLLTAGLRPPTSIAIVEVGTNDWLGFRAAGPWKPTPLPIFASGYRRLLAEVAGEPGQVRLVCLGVWASAAARNPWGAAASEYDDVIATHCKAWRGHFEPLAGVYDSPGCRGPAGRPTPNGMTDDQHPNDLGHRRIAGLLQRAL